MAETTETTEAGEAKQKNIVERLADVGEGAIQRLGSAPGGDKVMSTLGGMRDRLDELQRRAIRGMDDMQKRMTALEERVDRLEGKHPSAAGPATGAAGAAAASTGRSAAAQPSKKGDGDSTSTSSASGTA